MLLLTIPLLQTVGCGGGTSAATDPSQPNTNPPVAPATVPATPTGLQAGAGDAQVALTWAASSGATAYHVKRAAASGGPYSQVAAPMTASFTDPALSNGTTY